MTGTGTVGLDNPFIQVYDALWEMAERNDVLMDYVRPRNRIKYDNLLGPKTAISSGDVPELELLQVTAIGNFHSSSSSSSMIRTYTWAITTAEYALNDYYNIVCWELYRAMVDWDITLCALVWPDDDWHFVIKANMMDAEEGTILRKRNRNIAGWVGMWSLEVEMCFRTIDLRIL